MMLHNDEKNNDNNYVIDYSEHNEQMCAIYARNYAWQDANTSPFYAF
jgi:hypothetical protein